MEGGGQDCAFRPPRAPGLIFLEQAVPTALPDGGFFCEQFLGRSRFRSHVAIATKYQKVRAE